MTDSRPIGVLIAEDDVAVRTTLSLVVESEPSLILLGAVEGADEAIEIAARVHPDVAIVDVNMPGGGENAVRGIASVSPETEVIVLTASNDRSTVFTMLEAGAIGYLLKG